jgi:Adaptive response protein AidB N-terminal domain
VRLRNTYRCDVVLQEHLERLLPAEVRTQVEPELDQMGEAAAGELARLADQAEGSPPRLVQYDPWGRRVDRIELDPAWAELHAIQARAGLSALPYEDRHGPYDRIVQLGLLHLYAPSSAVYSCPVAMTDGAVRVLVDHAPAELRELAFRLGRTYAAALLARHAAHRQVRLGDDRAARVARRYADRWLGGPGRQQARLARAGRGR